METHNFTASLFYYYYFYLFIFFFLASEVGKIGPYAPTPCKFLNITEIFLHWKDY